MTHFPRQLSFAACLGVLRLEVLWLGAFVLIGLSLSPAMAAQSTVKLCNETSYVLHVATAFQKGVAARSNGWQVVMPGQCRDTAKTIPDAAQGYVFARSDRAHAGEGLVFSGNERFCVAAEADDFAIEGRRECRRRGFVEADFAPIAGSGSRRSVSFTEKQNYGSQRASTAGVQRLLSDLQFDIKHIDGFGGRQTREAIDAYRQRFDITGDSQNKQLLEALIKTARQQASARGLLFCNSTDYLVWAATGRVKNDTFESRGWLRVLPRQCAQAINQDLDERYYFYYAEAVDAQGDVVVENGRRKIWAGGVDMCVKGTKFVISGNQNCQARGYEVAGFRQIDTGTTRKSRVTLE